jgi:hypothetical protein
MFTARVILGMIGGLNLLPNQSLAYVWRLLVDIWAAAHSLLLASFQMKKLAMFRRRLYRTEFG